ncbi:MAG: DUF3788 domain-containing protein [Firmicutes bacterium]|nr:DUF3788 domain-containing protein [Bacillota bacterium]
MKYTMDNNIKQLLRLTDPNIEPTVEVLKNVLGESYTVFEELSAILTNEKYCLTMNRNYHKNILAWGTKAWFCRVMYKKKTIFWLSAFDGYFRTTFFFLDRHIEGISKLETSEDSFRLGKEFWNVPNVIFVPFDFNIKSNEQIPDLLKIVEYRKRTK